MAMDGLSLSPTLSLCTRKCYLLIRRHCPNRHVAHESPHISGLLKFERGRMNMSVCVCVTPLRQMN